MNEAVTALVRQHDPDRFLTAMFAPVERRDALLVLYAFNHELARAREVAREPMMALIRLQWWREVVDGTMRRHDVATPLSAALAAGALQRDDLLAMIDARETEADPEIDTQATWRDYLFTGHGSLAVAAARLLGAPDAQLFRSCGAAYGGAGLLRSVAAAARAGRCLLPVDLLHARGLQVTDVLAAPGSAPVQGAVAALGLEVRQWLAAAPRRVPRHLVAAALPAVLAGRDLRRLDRAPGPRGVGDRLAVIIAGLTGRL